MNDKRQPKEQKRLIQISREDYVHPLAITEMPDFFDRDHPVPGEDHMGDTIRASRSLIAKGIVIYDPLARRPTKNRGTLGVMRLARRLTH